MLCQVHKQLKLHQPLHRQQVGAASLLAQPPFGGWKANLRRQVLQWLPRF
jgi:hypothetical protein